MYYKYFINYASSSVAFSLVFVCIINYAPRVVSYAPKVMLQIVASLTIIIYDCNMFIVQATHKKLYLSSNTHILISPILLSPML
jgi:hypothetical protein